VVSTERSIEIVDPADGTPVGSVLMASPEDVARAAERARAAQPAWARTAAAERAAMLHDCAARLRAHATDLAVRNEQETGRSRAEAEEGVRAGAGTLDQYAELGPVHRGKTLNGDWSSADFMVAEPRGVVAALTPWNDPVAVACGLLGAALVTGNTVLHKPSERVPHTGALLGELFEGVFPDAVFQTLQGDGSVGQLLTRRADIDVYAHVGSTRAGRSIATAAAATGAKALLENGGNDALVIDEDVDPAWAAEQAALGSFVNSGQVCVSVERILVHEAIADEFLRELVSKARAWQPAPLVDRRHRAEVQEKVEDAERAGATILTGGFLPDGPGAHYPATVLNGCDEPSRAWSEETFGPVAPVRVVPSFDEGLTQAADDEYGLAATVLTGSLQHAQKAWRALPVGTVKVNAVFGGAPGGAAHPRRASGNGFGYGPELLDEMTETKVVHLGIPG
jgi:acyl-CoA reductase-like NAD-dependent aldehyde dehydrogenase